MALKFAWLFVALAAPALAEPVRLDGAALRQALAGVTLAYQDGTSQSFAADGTTIFDGGRGPSTGRWRIEGDRYCSVWPPSDAWACYDVTRDADGSIGFVADSGQVSLGHPVK